MSTVHLLRFDPAQGEVDELLTAIRALVGRRAETTDAGAIAAIDARLVELRGRLARVVSAGGPDYDDAA